MTSCIEDSMIASDLLKLPKWQEKGKAALQKLRERGDPVVINQVFPLVIRKEFHRWRQRVLNTVRWGERRAERDYGLQIVQLVRQLEGKKENEIDFLNDCGGMEVTEQTRHKLYLAVLQKFGGKEGLSEDKIIYHANILCIEGILIALVARGEVISKLDSYGRTFYKMKR